MNTEIAPIHTMKKGQRYVQHGGEFELIEDVHPSIGHVNNWDGIGPSDVLAAKCVCVAGEIQGYFKPGSDWTLQGRIGVAFVNRIK